MELEHNQCYAIIKSRDERFDGRFFTGVLTTGIYCRPICPAVTPRPENVRFFATAAAAADAGFRPCLRCRPESSPGTPEWQGSSATVSRALRMIGEGVVDEADSGLDEVAQRLHIGPRQLRRLFVKHLGVPPIAVVQTRRVHFAKKLIDETTLPMSEIAFSAGFASIRRFNDVIRQIYGKTPTALRRHNNSTGPAASHLTLKLAYRPPLDWRSLLDFLQARAIPGVEYVEKGVYQRTVQVGEVSGIIQVRPLPRQNYLELCVPVTLSRHLQQIVQRVRHLFDLQADPAQVAAHLKADGLLAPLVTAYPGLRLPGAWDGFEIAIRAILGQQVSVKAATTLSGRLVRRCGTPLNQAAPPLTHLFPQPAQLLAADLSGLGITGQRLTAVQAVAQAVHHGRLSFHTTTSLADAVETLTALPGIGDWTAHYIALRALAEPDAFPASDLILRRAAGDGETPLTAAQLKRRAESWRPWRAYAAMYLWKSYTAG